MDTLDEYGFFSEADAVFQRMVQEQVIRQDWYRKGGFEIDLHTFSRGVAKCAVSMALDRLTEKLWMIPKEKKMDDLRIIIGVGRKSKN